MDERTLFEQRVKKNKALVLHFISRYIFDVDLRHDIMQQTFLRAWIVRDSFEGRGSYEGWLKKIAATCTFNYLVSHQHKITIAKKEYADGLNYEDLHSLDHYLFASPLDQLIQDHDLILAAEALKALPKPFQEAIVLSLVYGHTYEEIAAIANIPIGTVRSRIFRGKQLMQWEVEQKLNKPTKRPERKG